MQEETHLVLGCVMLPCGLGGRVAIRDVKRLRSTGASV